MNRSLKTLAATAITLSLAVVGLPLTSGDGGMTISTGTSGCCRQ
ncbi:hypothetical protein [Actinotalea subterranea]|nr:hypothetical protein [Actinotalea subterranea]